MHKVGFVGWRGMVGSVLMNRMREEGDFGHFESHFFTTSKAGKAGPDVGHGDAPLKDATSISLLAEMDVIISCQGGGFTEEVYPAFSCSRLPPAKAPLQEFFKIDSHCGSLRHRRSLCRHDGAGKRGHGRYPR